MRNAIALLLLTAATLPGMADTPTDAKPANGGIQSLRLQPTFENADGSKTERRLLPTNPVLVFALVTGSIGFSFPGSTAVTLPGSFSGFDAFDVDLNSWMETAVTKVKAADKRLPEGVSITPAETRMGYVTALAYARGGGLGNRFIGKRQGMSLRVSGGTPGGQLTFFDRACRTSGTVRTPDGEKEVSMELGIPAPGFYLLTLMRESDSRVRVVAQEVSSAVERELVITFR